MPINKPFLFDSDSLKNFHKRIFFSVLIFCFCFGAAFFKITYISASSYFDEPSKVTINQDLKRGNIYDRNGLILAATINSKSLYAQANLINDIDLLSKNLLSSSPKDALATLTELTARSVQLAIDNNNLDPKEIVACGGGVKNKFLMQRISELTSLSVFTTADEGLDPQAIESMAFAWFGYRRIKNIPSIVPTGKNISTKALLGSITKIK